MVCSPCSKALIHPNNSVATSHVSDKGIRALPGRLWYQFVLDLLYIKQQVPLLINYSY